MSGHTAARRWLRRISGYAPGAMTIRGCEHPRRVGRVVCRPRDRVTLSDGPAPRSLRKYPPLCAPNRASQCCSSRAHIGVICAWPTSRRHGFWPRRIGNLLPVAQDWQSLCVVERFTCRHGGGCFVGRSTRPTDQDRQAMSRRWGRGSDLEPEDSELDQGESGRVRSSSQRSSSGPRVRR